jgi:hypothetical protein
MPVYQGAAFTKVFIIKDKTTNTPIDITGWEFQAQFRDRVDDANYLVQLTSDDGNFVVTDGPNGQITMTLTAEETALFPTGKIVFDVLRTDPTPGPLWLFGGRFPVKQPVTRNE